MPSGVGWHSGASACHRRREDQSGRGAHARRTSGHVSLLSIHDQSTFWFIGMLLGLIRIYFFRLLPIIYWGWWELNDKPKFVGNPIKQLVSMRCDIASGIFHGSYGKKHVLVGCSRGWYYLATSHNRNIDEPSNRMGQEKLGSCHYIQILDF